MSTATSTPKTAVSMFVNLSVRDLQRSKAFFSQLGYSFNAQFTNDDAACLVIGDNIFAMLVTEAMFKTITDKPICDSHKSNEVLLALSAASRAAVDAIADKALAVGGKAHKEPQDHGFMYSRSFQDPDGHIWDHFWMDPAHVQG